MTNFQSDKEEELKQYIDNAYSFMILTTVIQGAIAFTVVAHLLIALKDYVH